MQNPLSYGLAEPVELTETHISRVHLAGPSAWKMKRAVKLPYVGMVVRFHRQVPVVPAGGNLARALDINERRSRCQNGAMRGIPPLTSRWRGKA